MTSNTLFLVSSTTLKHSCHSTITAKLQYEHLIEHGAVMRLTESGFGARLTNRQKAVGYGKGHS